MTAVTVYLIDGSCSCRACGLDWKAVQLEDCPRCEADSLRAYAGGLTEGVQDIELVRTANVQMASRIKELEQGIEDLYVERDRARERADTLAGRLQKARLRLIKRGAQITEARTIARQLVALVRKLRGDLDGTKGQLKRVLGVMGVDIA